MREVDKIFREHIPLVTNAAEFAARRHSGQTRKGTAAEPYINHLAEVVSLLASSLEEPDAHLVAAAWLHDTIEHTATTEDELKSGFGNAKTGIVLEMTDDKRLPKTERKQLQVLNTPDKSESARLLTLADLISNLRWLAASPPAHWELERWADYVAWAEHVARSCRGPSTVLKKPSEAAVSPAQQTIAVRAPTDPSA